MKILINVPSPKILGGVSNHYKGLRTFWTEDVKYNIIGKRCNKAGSGIYWLPWDIIKFIFKLLFFKPDILILNPSLGINALKRDFIFLRIANVLKFKIVVFFHGFNLDIAASIDKSWMSKNLNKATLIYVLAQSFKSEILKWGVKTPISLTTTKVDNNLILNYIRGNERKRIKNILFLSRIEKEKGIYESLEAYILLSKHNPDLEFTIVGDGSEFDRVKEFVEVNKLNKVHLKGKLEGDSLAQSFMSSDIYLLPSYSEGMPTSVLEAMAFGLPIITRNVGGLVDFFKNDQMGLMLESKDPKDFANAISNYIDDVDKVNRISYFNHDYAVNNFMASKVAIDIENRLKEMI